jgi:transcription factor E
MKRNKKSRKHARTPHHQKRVKRLVSARRAQHSKARVRLKVHHVSRAKPIKHVIKNVKIPAVRKNIEDIDRQRSTKKSRAAAANVYTPEEVMKAVNELSGNEVVVGYLKKNISKRAIDVINKLVTPKTDEDLAAELEMKINAVRRILNLMQGCGITNYYVAKNVNGWLSFAWYINVAKLPPFFEYVNSIENRAPAISNDCNDYFMCNGCYENTKLIFTFDAAFEEGFKCNSCGKSLVMMDRAQATKLITSASAQP